MSLEPPGDPRPSQFTLRGLFVLTAVVAMLLAITFPGIRLARDRARRDWCQDSLRITAVATHNYHDYCRCFPPAQVADAMGCPMYSWRGLLWPFVGGDWEFRSDEPWNGPSNGTWTTAWSPPCYCCGTDQPIDKNQPNYVMIVGPGMLSDGLSSTTIPEIADGASNTIMFVETTGVKTPWAAPGDLEAAKITFKVNDSQTLGISSAHPGGANCAFCDGSVAFLPNSIDPAVIRAMCTINGGEKVER